MVILNPDSEEVVRRGRLMYEARLRAQLETTHPGEFLILNVHTGEYEVDRDDVAASRRARLRFPDAPLLTIRIGHAAAFRIGGRSLKTK